MRNNSVEPVSAPRKGSLSHHASTPLMAKSNPEAAEVLPPRLLDRLRRQETAFLERLDRFLATEDQGELLPVTSAQHKLAWDAYELGEEKRGAVRSYIELLLQLPLPFAEAPAPEELPPAERIKPRGQIVFRLRVVLCGKDCSGCPHGPYWYAQWRDQTGKLRSRYIGKELRMKAVEDLVS